MMNDHIPETKMLIYSTIFNTLTYKIGATSRIS